LEHANDCGSAHKAKDGKENNDDENHIQHESIIAVLADRIELRVHSDKITTPDSAD